MLSLGAYVVALGQTEDMLRGTFPRRALNSGSMATPPGQQQQQGYQQQYYGGYGYNYPGYYNPWQGYQQYYGNYQGYPGYAGYYGQQEYAQPPDAQAVVSARFWLGTDLTCDGRFPMPSCPLLSQPTPFR